MKGPRVIEAGAVRVEHSQSPERARQTNDPKGVNNDQRQLRKRRANERLVEVPKPKEEKVGQQKPKPQNEKLSSKNTDGPRQVAQGRKEIMRKSTQKPGAASPPPSSTAPVPANQKRREESAVVQNQKKMQMQEPKWFENSKFNGVTEVDEIPNHLEVLDDKIWGEPVCPHCSTIEEIEAMLKAEADRYTRLTEKYERVDEWVSNNRQFSGSGGGGGN